MTTETKFTPGPWEGKVGGVYQPSDWEAHNDSAMTYEYAPVVDERGRTVCLVVDDLADYTEDNTRLDYNAHLIAAAPRMYAALDAMANGEGLPPGETIERILADARGES